MDLSFPGEVETEAFESVGILDVPLTTKFNSVFFLMFSDRCAQQQTSCFQGVFRGVCREAVAFLNTPTFRHGTVSKNI